MDSRFCMDMVTLHSCIRSETGKKDTLFPKMSFIWLFWLSFGKMDTFPNKVQGCIPHPVSFSKHVCRCYVSDPFEKKKSAGKLLPLIRFVLRSFVLRTLGYIIPLFDNVPCITKSSFLPRMVQMLNEGIGQNRKVYGSSGFGTALTTSILSRLLIDKILCNTRSHCKTANPCLVWAGHVFQ